MAGGIPSSRGHDDDPALRLPEGDTIGLLVLARPEETVAELAGSCGRRRRCACGGKGAVVVQHGERVLDPRATVGQVLAPLDRFDVRFTEPRP
jgi:hypothetical protein